MLVGEGEGRLVFRLGDEDQRGLVLVFGEMAVHAVVTSIDSAADKPFPKGGLAGVEGLAPGLVPVEEGSVMVEAFGKILFAEFLDESAVSDIPLGDQFLRRLEGFFLLPTH